MTTLIRPRPVVLPAPRRLLSAGLALLLAALSALTGAVLTAGPAAAAGSPDVSLTVTAPATVLLGAPVKVSLRASNPNGQPPGYNAAFSAVLPTGVSYVPGSTSGAGEPRVIADQPSTGSTTLVWSNVNDIQPGGAQGLSFSALPGAAPRPVASSFQVSGTVLISDDARTLPAYDAAGAPIGSSYSGNASATSSTTNVTAFTAKIEEPSSEHELVRGVHSQTTIYTVTLTNNPTTPTNGVTAEVFLPAGLEYLGCGATDNSGAGTREYPGAPRLGSAAPSPCPTPTSVETVTDPPGRPAGVYTVVTYAVGTLSTTNPTVLRYRAGIPLRANTATFSGGAPTPASGQQGSNLDNNTGPSTRETGSEQSLETTVAATGTYPGPVASGGSSTVGDNASVTVTSEDLALAKGVNPTTFTGGGIATYTLTLRTGEYRDATAITLTDLLPNGLCPLSDNASYASGSDCAANPSYAPTGATIASAPQNPDGSFTVTFNPIGGPIPDNGTYVVTYQARMRASFTGSGSTSENVTAKPTAAGDSFTNTVSLTGTSRPLSAAPDPEPPLTVNDESSATIVSNGPSIDKTVAARATPMDCATGSYSDATPTFAKGDRACFRLRVAFDGANSTRRPVVTDFLPDSLTYEPGSAVVLRPETTVPDAQISFSDAGASTGVLSWTLGEDKGGGIRYVAPGAVFSVQLAARFTRGAAGPAPEVPGNLMKLRTENTAGQAVSLRDMVDVRLAPPPPLEVKVGVRSVDGSPAGGSPPGTSGTLVREGSAVEYRVDVSNKGTAANDNNRTVEALRVLATLPDGITCSARTATSDGGTCFDAGAPGRPAVAPAGLSVILWQLPASDTIAAGASRAPLTFTVTQPTPTSVSAKPTVKAGVVRYDVRTDLNGSGSGETTTHYPASNIDTSVPVTATDAPAANGSGNAAVRDVAASLAAVTSVDEAGNNSGSQATIGETVTLTARATIPARTTAYNGRFTLTLPAGLSQESVTSRYYPSSTSAPTTLPSGVSQDSTGAGLTFPATYDNQTDDDQSFELVVTARVAKNGNAHGNTRTSTATFRSSTAASGGGAVPDRTAARAVTIVEPDPTLTKANAAGPTVTAGQTITYTLTAGNAGTRPPAHDTLVVDCLPAGLTFGAYGTPGQGSTAPAEPGSGTAANGCATGTTRLLWRVGSVTGGTSRALTYTATVDPGAAGSAAFANNATLNSSTLNSGKTEPNQADDPNERSYLLTQTSTVTVAGSAASQTVSPGSATIGQPVTYALTATVPANVNFYDAWLRDTLPAPLDPAVTTDSVTCTNADGTPCTLPDGGTAMSSAASGTDTLIGWRLGDLTSSTQVRTVTATYRTTLKDLPANARGSVVTNSGTLRWSTTNGTTPTSAGATGGQATGPGTVPLTVEEPLVTLTNTVDKPDLQPSETAVFTVTATSSNAASVSTAYDLVVVDTIPAGLDVDPATISNGGSYDSAARTVTWSIPALAKAASAARTFSARLSASAGLSAGAKTTAAQATYRSQPNAGRSYGPTTPAATASVTPKLPRLVPSAATPNGDVGYADQSFTWRAGSSNTGTGDAQGVDVRAVLPQNWTYDAGSARASVNGGPATPVEPAVTGQALDWTDVAALAAAQAVLVTFTATPSSAALTAPGSGHGVNHRLTVTTTGDDRSGSDGSAAGPYGSGTATADGHLDRADLRIAVGTTGSYVAGGTGSWTLDVTNLGPDTAVGPFTVTNALPAGVTFASVTGGGWTCTSASCTRTSSADTLASGAAFPRITVTGTIPADTAEASTLTDEASVSGRTHDSVSANNTSSAAGTVTTRADLQVTQSHSGSARAGEPFTWTMGVANLGPSTSRGPITVTDTLGAGTSFVGSTGAGWNCSATGQTVTCSRSADLLAGAAAPQLALTVAVASSSRGPVTSSATASGPTSDPVTGNNTAADSAAVTREADLSLSKTRSGAVVPGTNATYRLTVRDNGPADASGVTVTDPLPGGATYVSSSDVRGSWSCSGTTTVVCSLTGDLVASDEATVELVVAIPSGATGPLVNTATVSASTTDPAPGNNSGSDDSTLAGTSDLAVSNSHSGSFTAGREATWILGVRNNGPSDTPGPLTLSDTLPEGTTFTSATGTGWTCSATGRDVTCTRPDGLVSGASAPGVTLVAAIDPTAGPGTLVNRASVDGPLSDPVAANDTAADTAAVVDEADVSVVSTVTSGATVPAGGQLVYRLRVSNAGPSAADDLLLTDAIPTGTTLVSATGEGWTCSSGPGVSCTRASLGLASSDVTVVLRVASSTPAGTVLPDAAGVSTSTPGDLPGDNTSNDSATVTVSADLALGLTHSGSGAAGTTVTLTATVTNTGPSDAAGPLQVIDTLPAGFTYTSASGAGWTCSANSAGSVVTCVQASGVPAGASAPPLTITAQVASGATPGPVSNTAVLSGPTPDPSAGNNTASDPITVARSADLSVRLTHQDPGKVGGTVTFDVAVSSSGPSTATGVVVTSTLPAGLTYQAGTGAGWTCAATGQQVRCSLASPLATGNAPPLQVLATVGPAAAPSVTVSVRVASDAADPVPANDTASDVVPVTGIADLALTTRLLDGSTRALQRWEVTVKNLGPSASPDAVVTDRLAASLSYLRASGPGWSCAADGQLVTCRHAGPIAVGEVSSLVIETAYVGTDGAPVQNRATVDGSTDTEPANDSAVASFAVSAAEAEPSPAPAPAPSPAPSPPAAPAPAPGPASSPTPTPRAATPRPTARPAAQQGNATADVEDAGEDEVAPEPRRVAEGRIPFTGFETSPLLLLAGLLLGTGTALLVAARPRRG